MSPPLSTTFNELSLSSDTFSVPTAKIPTSSTCTVKDETLGNMSFATVEYLRRYHLLDSDELLDIPNLKLLPKLL